MFASINAAEEDAEEAARVETAEAKASRLTASYRDALRHLQRGERAEAEGAPPFWSHQLPLRLTRYAHRPQACCERCLRTPSS